MIATVLDTNVVSELIRPTPDPAVVRFVDALGTHAYLTSVSVAELVFGADRLPAGARSDRVRAAVDATIEEFVAADRCVGLDAVAAAAAGRFKTERERAGRPVLSVDTLIAGICISNALALATRNVGGFEGAGLTLVDPWTDPPPVVGGIS